MMTPNALSYLTIITFLMLFLKKSAIAQIYPDTSKQLNPKFLALNYEENYSYLGSKNRSTLWQKLKYIPLFKQSYLTIGGELRPRLEYREHLRYGKGNEDHGFDFQQRSRLWTDIHFTNKTRVFAEVKSGTTSGLDFPASAVDNNTVEIHQAFAEFAQSFSNKTQVYIRAGRQEISFGKARLFDVRQPPANRRAYDAVRIGLTSGKWKTGIIGGSDVEDKAGAFNDRFNSNYRFFAAYLSHAFGGSLSGSALEALYLFTDRKTAANTRFIGKRNSLSFRWSGMNKALNYDIELIGQSGTTANAHPICAWYAGSEGAYTLSSSAHPYFGWRIDIASGDRDSLLHALGSYDFLWSRGQSLAPDLGFTNIAAIGPTIGVKPVPKLAIDLSAQKLWRLSTHDGIYAMSGAPVRFAHDGKANDIGWRTTCRTEYTINSFLLFGIYANRTFKATYLSESDSGESMFYGNLYALFRF